MYASVCVCGVRGMQECDYMIIICEVLMYTFLLILML